MKNGALSTRKDGSTVSEKAFSISHFVSEVIRQSDVELIRPEPNVVNIQNN